MARRSGRWALFVFVVLAGCGGIPRGEETVRARPVGELHPPATYALDFSSDQRVTIAFGDRSESFRAVVEKIGDRLVMVGFGPHGGRAFALTQHAAAVEFQSFIGRELPFDPEWMLLDVHRTWLVGLTGPLPDGEHEDIIDGIQVRERWEGGRLRERGFSIMTSNLAGWGVHVTYEGGFDARDLSTPPARVVLESHRAGSLTGSPQYVLTLEGITLSPAATPSAPSE